MLSRQPDWSRLRAVAFGASAAIAMLCPSFAAAGDADVGLAGTVTVTGSVQRLDVTVDACPVSLERQAGMPTQRVYLHYRNDCDLALAAKLELLTKMTRVLIGDGQPSQGITLFVGRVVQSFPDVARQAAEAAAADPQWAAEPRTESGHANKAFARLIAGTQAARDVAAAFAPWRLELSRVSVEKVLAAPPNETPFAAWLSGDDPVPFDALTHFRFDPAAE